MQLPTNRIYGRTAMAVHGFIFCVIITGYMRIVDSEHANQVLPKPMSLSKFRRLVAGQSYKELYFLEEPFTQEQQKYRNVNTTWTIVHSTRIQRKADLRRLDTGTCDGLATVITPVSEQHFRRKWAVFDSAEYNVRFFLFSNQPSKYLFEFGCYHGNFTDTTCLGSYFLSVYTARDPPNQFPWLRVAKELFKQVRLDFEDRRFSFTRLLNNCPEEIDSSE